MTGRLGLALALVLAVALRVVAEGDVAASPRTYAPLIDSEAYLLQALRVADGAPLVDGVTFQAPLYPWLLGWTLRLAGVPGARVERVDELPPATLQAALSTGRMLNRGLGLVLVVLVWLLGRRLLSPGAGTAAALLAAGYGPALFYEGHLLKVSLSLVMLPLAVLVGARALERGRARDWIPVGLVLGLGGLVRGNIHLLTAGAALLLALGGLRRGALRSGLLAAGALVLGAALALAPVIVRNSLVAGEPVLSTAAGGTAFYLCNHAGNDTGLVEHLPGNRQVPRHEFEDWEQAAEAAVGHPLTPAEISSYWFGQARDEILADPGRWALVELRKLALLVSRYEAPDNTLVALGEAESPLLAATPSRYGIAWPLAAGGLAWLWLRRRGRPPAPGRGLLLLAPLAYGATLLLFNMTARFRMPVAPFVLLGAGVLLAGLPGLVSRATLRERSLVAGAVLLALALGRVSEGPLGPLDAAERATHLAVRYKNRGQVAWQEGDLEGARRDLVRAEQVARQAGKSSPDVLALLGELDRETALALEARGEPGWPAHRQAARDHATRALELNPSHGAALRLSGLLHYDAGRWGAAEEALVGSLEAVPLDRTARLYLVLSRLQDGRPAAALPEAEALATRRPDHDDGHGLLAWCRLLLGDDGGARAALAEYDRLAREREARGLPRRLPDLPAFAPLRSQP